MATRFKTYGLHAPDMSFWNSTNCGYEDAQPIKIQEIKPYELPPRVMGCWTQPFVGIEERGIIDGQANEPVTSFPIKSDNDRYGSGPRIVLPKVNKSLPLQSNF